MSRINRRDFIATSLTAAVTAYVTTGIGLEVTQAGVPPDVEAWYDRTMRWVQLILVDSDPGAFDPQWWLDLFRNTHVDGLCLSAGGITAFYPTEIPFHHKSKWMKDGDDPFGALVIAARKMGITIVARTDSHSCLDDAAKAHPEWLNIDETGKPRRHWELPETRWVTCALGPYNFDFMTRVHHEITEKYQIDGLFCNRWQPQARGMCYCESCQRLFRAFSGMDLPRGTNSIAAQAYAQWELVRLTELWRLWDGEIRKIKPTARYFSNTGIDIDRAAELAPTYLCEQQARRTEAPWNFGNRGKQLRTIFGKKPIIGISGITLNSRQSVAPEAEIKIWLLDAIANGLRPWIGKTSAVNPDKRWVPALEKVFGWHYRSEKYMRNEENLASVAMLFSPGSRGDGNAASGMYQVLVEARIPFEMAYSRMLDPAHIDRYKLLILPNVTNLTDTECEQLRQYVNRGGSLLATFQTSLYTGGELRPNFGLSDLFGVAYACGIESNGPNGYIRIEADTKHPILKGIEDVGQIVSTSQHLNVRALVSFPNPPLTRIPTYSTIPMEEIYPRIPKTDIPEVYLRIINERSRVVYFPGDIDATFANGMAPDLALIIRNAVGWAMNEAQPVTVSGPGILDVTYWRQANSMTVHMVNMTNPFMLRSPYREDIPIGSQRVTIRFPADRIARGVKLLVAGVTPYVERSGNELTITVPSIVDHEVVAIDL
ncbi:MAG: alpha-amylase family protein [Daejeonella sp.]